MEHLLLLKVLDQPGLAWAAEMCKKHHYLGRMVDPRTMPMGYMIVVAPMDDEQREAMKAGLLLETYTAGLLLFGRPEATRCRDWYGSVADVFTGRCEVTRWQVLNLSRVLLLPHFQVGGPYHGAKLLPGYWDRRGVWRSTLASTAIKMAMQRVGFDYLLQYPPVFPDEPFVIRWLMSYCDTRLHRGVIYQASGFERYETGNEHIQTWRAPLPRLTCSQTEGVLFASQRSERAKRIRAERAQLKLFGL